MTLLCKSESPLRLKPLSYYSKLYIMLKHGPSLVLIMSNIFNSRWWFLQDSLFSLFYSLRSSKLMLAPGLFEWKSYEDVLLKSNWFHKLAPFHLWHGTLQDGVLTHLDVLNLSMCLLCVSSRWSIFCIRISAIRGSLPHQPSIALQTYSP